MLISPSPTPLSRWPSFPPTLLLRCFKGDGHKERFPFLPRPPTRPHLLQRARKGPSPASHEKQTLLPGEYVHCRATCLICHLTVPSAPDTVTTNPSIRKARERENKERGREWKKERERAGGGNVATAVLYSFRAFSSQAQLLSDHFSSCKLAPWAHSGQVCFSRRLSLALSQSRVQVALLLSPLLSLFLCPTSTTTTLQPYHLLYLSSLTNLTLSLSLNTTTHSIPQQQQQSHLNTILWPGLDGAVILYHWPPVLHSSRPVFDRKCHHHHTLHRIERERCFTWTHKHIETSHGGRERRARGMKRGRKRKRSTETARGTKAELFLEGKDGQKLAVEGSDCLSFSWNWARAKPEAKEGKRKRKALLPPLEIINKLNFLSWIVFFLSL